MELPFNLLFDVVKPIFSCCSLVSEVFLACPFKMNQSTLSISLWPLNCNVDCLKPDGETIILQETQTVDSVCVAVCFWECSGL